jgi:hypothetical protein
LCLGKFDFRLALDSDVSAGAVDVVVFLNPDPRNVSMTTILAPITILARLSVISRPSTKIEVTMPDSSLMGW